MTAFVIPDEMPTEMRIKMYSGLVLRISFTV